MNKRTITIRSRSKDTPHPMMEEFIASSSPPTHPSNNTSKTKAPAEETPPTHNTNIGDPKPPDPPKPLPPKLRSTGTAHSDDDPSAQNPPPTSRVAFAKPAISALAASAVLAALEVTPGESGKKRKAAELSPGRADSPPPPGDPNPPPPGDPNPPPAGPPPASMKPEVGLEREGEKQQGPGCPGPPPTKPLPPDPPR